MIFESLADKEGGRDIVRPSRPLYFSPVSGLFKIPQRKTAFESASLPSPMRMACIAARSAPKQTFFSASQP